jgi:hypothetical protein
LANRIHGRTAGSWVDFLLGDFFLGTQIPSVLETQKELKVPEAETVF